jgi:hypothetical protein
MLLKKAARFIIVLVGTSYLDAYETATDAVDKDPSS